MTHFLRWTLAGSLLLSGCATKPKSQAALSAADALKSFKLSEDFDIQTFAAEPDVADPVEMVFDENGRIYVAEMHDYPDDPPPGKPARSRIRLLEDADGDGKFEKNVVFADQVLEVSGLAVWNGGLIVTTAPDIVFMKDTNGDGVADVNKVLNSVFPKANPEARITNPRLGIDNWFWCANEGRDGRIVSPDHPERPPVMVRGADFRFHPVKGVAEPASGPTQFGMTFDNWGNRFLSQNTVHLRHAVVPMQYLARAPLLEVGAVSEDISDHGKPSAPMFPLTQPQAWRVERTKLRQQRYDENKLNRVEQLAGFFTAASGGTVYTGDNFPKEYLGNVFTGDVSGNLVHRDILRPDGVTFQAARAKDGVEFLASTDQWFRPCNFANAPDGNLYVIDIYREYIETPESIPEEIKKNMDFYAGDTMGRIYRLSPKNPRRKAAPAPKLGALSGPQLAELLENENGWHRQTAQRLIVERQDKSAAPALHALAAKSVNPLARLHALWTLEGIGELKPDEVARALKDPTPGIREHALRMAEEFLPQLGDAALAAAADPDPRVEFQAALTLGNVKSPRALPAIAGIADRHAADKWFRIAMLSSVSNAPGQFLQLLSESARNQMAPQLAALVGSRKQPAELAQVLQLAAKSPKPEEVLDGLARGLKLVSASGVQAPGAEAALLKLFDNPSEPVQKSAWEVARHFELRAVVAKAKTDAAAPGLAPPARVRAIRALRGGQYADVSGVLAKILDSNPPSEIQAAAIDSLAAFNSPAVTPLLLSHWRAYSPDARARTVASLLATKDRTEALLKALEDSQVEPAALDIAARARLSELGDRAKKLLKDSSSDRVKVFESHRDVAAMKGEVARGKALFDENCAKCHMPRRQGGRVGPDLSGINNKTKEELLMSILNPSYAIEPRFTNYIVTTKDGRVHDGVIASETPAVLTLRGGTEEGDDIILRSNIAEIRSSTVSLMPDEFEKTLSKQGLADIIAYLRGGL